LFLLILTMDLR